MWFCLSLKRLQSLTKRSENIAREEESWQDDVSLGDNEDSWGNEDFADNSQNNESRNRTKKPKGRPRADSQRAKIWFDEEVFALIEIWSNFEQLYNVKHSLYHLKDERAKNLGKVQQQLQKKGFEATTKQINEKMVVLKNYFSAEKRKSEALQRNLDLTGKIFIFQNGNFIGICFFLKIILHQRQQNQISNGNHLKNAHRIIRRRYQNQI